MAHSTGGLIYASSESDPDMLYKTGFMAPDKFLWFQAGEHQGLVVNTLEYGRARHEAAPEATVYSYKELKGLCSSKKRAPESIEDYIEVLSRKFDVDTWEVPADFPFELGKKLLDKGFNITVRTPFCPERKRKSKEEIEAIREGVELAESGFGKVRNILQNCDITHDNTLVYQGTELTAERLRGTINAEIALQGGCALHTIVAPGPQGADPHNSGSGTIKARQPIVIDIFPRVDATGYYGDFTRTVSVLEPPPVVQQAFDAVLETQQRALQNIKPDVAAKTFHAETAEFLEQEGFPQQENREGVPQGFFHGLGHGLGLELHEGPRIGKSSDAVLETGNVFTVEPGLYYTEWGGVRLEDVVVVEENACRNLTTFPKQLVITPASSSTAKKDRR